MITAELCETEVIGHVHRDIAGQFTPTATALQPQIVQTKFDIDHQVLVRAAMVLSRTRSLWEPRS